MAYGFLAEVALKSLVVLAIGFFAALVLRRTSAAVRHFAWLVIMFGLLMLPLFCWQMPTYRVVVPVRPLLTMGRAVRNVVAGDAHGAPAAVALPPDSYEDLTDTDKTGFTISAYMCLVAVWVLGCGAGLAHLALAARAVRRRFERAPAGAESVQVAAGSVAEELGLPSAPVVRHSDAPVPMTMGHFTPEVLLPASASDWPEGRLRAVLTHEMAHVKRRDWAAQMVAEVVCRLYWFNPLVWLAAERLRTESERAADEAVLRAGAVASDYASDLLTLAGSVARRQPSAALSIVRKSRVPLRIRCILSSSAVRRPLGLVPALALSTAALAGLTAMGMLRSVFTFSEARDPGGADYFVSAAEKLTLPSGTRVSILAVENSEERRSWRADGRSYSNWLGENLVWRIPKSDVVSDPVTDGWKSDPSARFRDIHLLLRVKHNPNPRETHRLVAYPPEAIQVSVMPSDPCFGENGFCRQPGPGVPVEFRASGFLHRYWDEATAEGRVGTASARDSHVSQAKSDVRLGRHPMKYDYWVSGIGAAVPPGVDRADLVVVIAEGWWREEATAEVRNGLVIRTSSDDFRPILTEDRVEPDGALLLGPSHELVWRRTGRQQPPDTYVTALFKMPDPLKSMASNVEIVTTNGEQLQGYMPFFGEDYAGRGFQPPDARGFVAISFLTPLNTVARIQLLTRPYTWIRFKEVHLEPNR